MITRELIEEIIPYASELPEEKIQYLLSLETIPLRGNSKNISGQRFNKLIAIDRGPTHISPCGVKKSQWWCICDCPAHPVFLVQLNNLRSGNTKSCGCHNLEQMKENGRRNGRLCAKDITNQRFGELTALHPTEERNNHSVVWECRCSCGKLHKVSAKDLINHRISSCGHVTESNGVREIKKILDKNNIPYTTEKTFESCKFENGASARFDFYVDNNYLIEFDGVQHFKELDYFHHDTLEERQQRDSYKNQWCLENNIPLIRIPYTDIWNLTLDDLQLGSKYTIS